MTMKYEELFNQVLPVLQSKMDEIKYYEYDGITIEDLWNYCIEKKWRKKSIENIRLYEMVATIYSVKASEIVSYFQIQQFHTTSNWFSELNQEELKELLKQGNPESE